MSTVAGQNSVETTSTEMLHRISLAFATNVLSIPVLGVINLATTAVIARALGVRLYGEYAILLAAVSTSILVLDFGIESSLQKIYPVATTGAPGELAHFVRKFTLVRLATFAVLLLLAWAAPRLTAFPPAGRLWAFPIALLAGMGLVQGPFSQLLYAFFRRFSTAAVSIGGALFQLVLSLAAVWAGFGLGGVIAAQILAAAVSLAAFVVLRLREVKAATVKSAQTCERTPALKPATFGDCTTIYVEKLSKYFSSAAFGILLTGSLLSPSDAALFAVATQLTTRLVTAVHAPLNGMILPLFAHQAALGDKGKLAATYTRVCRVLILLLVPLACALVGCASSLLKLLYGTGFQAAALAFQLIVVSVFAEAVLYSSGWNLLFVQGIPKLLQLSRAILILGVPASALAGAKFGMIGLVVCTRIPSLLSLLVLGVAVRRAVSLTLPWAFLFRVLIPGAIAAAVAWALVAFTAAAGVLTLLFYWTAFPVLFGVGFHLLGGLEASDKTLLKRLPWGPFEGLVSRL